MAETQGNLDATRKSQTALTDEELIQMFPRSHAMLKALIDKFAWWQQEDVVKEIKARFLDGSLLPGDEHYTHNFHIHPVAYLGQTDFGSFVVYDEPFAPGYLACDDDLLSTLTHQALTCVAFDIEDSEGRRWPLLDECMGQLSYGRGASYGTLLHRYTLRQLGRIHQADDAPRDSPGRLTLIKSTVDEVFADYS